MKVFLATVTIQPTDSMKKEANAEAEFVEAHRRSGRIRAIYATTDKRTTWHLLQSESEEEASQFLRTYPYAPWFEVESITPVVAVAD